jgi:hypothetical protein
MTDQDDEIGVILALINRFEKQRLPRLLKLREKVQMGEVLNEADIEFIEQVTHDAQQSKPLIDKHPEWQKFCAYVIHLYEEITEQALKNERQNQ